MPEPASSRRSVSMMPSSANLRRDVGAAPGRGDEAEHRRGEDEPPAPGGAHRRQQAVGQVDLAEEVGLEDRAQRRARQVLDRAGDGEGAVVEDRVEPPAGPRRAPRPPRRRRSASSARSRAKLRGPRAAQPRAVLRLAAGREDAPAAGRERAGGVEADSRGAAGDEDRAGHRRPATGRPAGRKRGCGEGAGSVRRNAQPAADAKVPVARARDGNVTPGIIHLDLRRDLLYRRRTWCGTLSGSGGSHGRVRCGWWCVLLRASVRRIRTAVYSEAKRLSGKPWTFILDLAALAPWPEGLRDLVRRLVTEFAGEGCECRGTT